MSTPAEHNLKVRAAERAQRAATVELYLQAFKCAEILSKYPETPTESDRVRFSHGLGRELWTATNAMGMYAAASFASLHGQISVPQLLQVLLQQVEWRGTEILIDIGKLDRAYLLENYPPNWDFEGTGLLGKEWWKDAQNLFEAFNPPSWMSCDSPMVPRPISVHLRDIGDASTIPGQMYGLAMNQHAEAELQVEREKQLCKDVKEVLTGSVNVPEPGRHRG